MAFDKSGELALLYSRQSTFARAANSHFPPLAISRTAPALSGSE